MARVGLVQTINLCSSEQTLIKGVMSNILVLLTPSILMLRALGWTATEEEVLDHWPHLKGLFLFHMMYSKINCMNVSVEQLHTELLQLCPHQSCPYSVEQELGCKTLHT